MQNFEQFGIKVPSGATGNIKTICPQCTPHLRKPHNRNSKDLSVNLADGLWNCHNCNWTGSLNKKSEKKEYIKPAEIVLGMDEKVISWFQDKRGISKNTLKVFGIGTVSEWMPQEQKNMNCIVFPYTKNGECVNRKYRSANKGFKLVSGAELLLWNYDGVMGKKTALITEGEIDALSVYETGWTLSGENGVASVPNGASKGRQRLDYLDNSWECLEAAEKIIIATDNDEAGLSLKVELIRRLGRDRCFEIQYPEGCKDLNEVLINLGTNGVLEVINNATPLPIEGILRLSDFEDEVDALYNEGYQQGAKSGFKEFDKLLNFSEGQLTTITGIPNSGKSAFIDQLLVRLANRNKWKIGVCSFENQPYKLHIDKLASCYIGAPMTKKKDLKMSLDEFKKAKEFLNENFFWFKMKDEDLSINGILERAKSLVRHHGINALLIDPYNYIDHQRKSNQTETEYISELLSQIDRFAEDYGVHVFLIAHPRKINKNKDTGDYEVPTLYDIAGSAHFYNKTDNGITVYRDAKSNVVTVYVQKVRFFMNGERGYCEFTFDPYTNRYKEITDADFEREYLFGTQGSEQEMPFYDNPYNSFKHREFDNETLPF